MTNHSDETYQRSSTFRFKIEFSKRHNFSRSAVLRHGSIFWRWTKNMIDARTLILKTLSCVLWIWWNLAVVLNEKMKSFGDMTSCVCHEACIRCVFIDFTHMRNYLRTWEHDEHITLRWKCILVRDSHILTVRSRWAPDTICSECLNASETFYTKHFAAKASDLCHPVLGEGLRNPWQRMCETKIS